MLPTTNASLDTIFATHYHPDSGYYYNERTDFVVPLPPLRDNPVHPPPVAFGNCAGADPQTAWPTTLIHMPSSPVRASSSTVSLFPPSFSTRIRSLPVIRKSPKARKPHYTRKPGFAGKQSREGLPPEISEPTSVMAVAMRHYEPAAMHKSSVESFYSLDEIDHRSQIASPQPKHPARQVRPSQLRLQTDLNKQQPTTHRRYQSDEEVPSPSMEEDYSEGQNSSTEDVAIDESIDLDHIEPLSATAPVEEAQSVHIVFSGKPSLINVGRIAPMQRRRRPAIAAASHRSPSPQRPPVPIPRRSSRRRNRSISMYEPPVVVDSGPQPKPFATPNQPHFHADSTKPYIGTNPSANTSSSYLSISSRNSSVTNFSAPHRHPVRPRLVEHHSTSTASSSISTSTASSSISTSSSPSPQLSRGPASPAETEPTEVDDDDVGDALLRESAEIQFRTQSSERERQLALAGEIEAGYYEDHDVLDEYHVEQGVQGYHVKHSSLDEDEYSVKKSLEAPTPTSYDQYDPYGMQPPSLADSRGRRGSAAAVASAAKKGWMGLSRAGRRRGAIAA